MSLARPRRKPIFHRARNPWPGRVKAVGLAGAALAVVISLKVAAGGYGDATAIDPRGLRLGGYAEAATGE